MPKENEQTTDQEKEEKPEGAGVLGKEQVEEQKEEEQPEAQEPQYSDEELDAIEQGWDPEEQFKGKEGHWITARQYLERKNSNERISKQAEELAELKTMNKSLFKLMKDQTDTQKQKEAEKLLSLKREAIAEADIEKAEKYEADLYKLVGNAAPTQETETTAQPGKEVYSEAETSAVKEFVTKNSLWYNNSSPMNKAMAAYADEVEKQLGITRPELPITERLNQTERAVKKEFPQMFENENRKRAPAVESNKYNSRRPAGTQDKTKMTYNDCPIEAKKVIDEMKRQHPSLDKDKYAQDLLDKGYIEYE